MQKKFAVHVLCAVLVFMSHASFADVDVWHDPSLKIADLKKVFIFPADSQLNA